MRLWALLLLAYAAIVLAKAVPYGNSADTYHVRLQGVDEARARLEADDQSKFQALKNWTVENGGWVSNKLGKFHLLVLACGMPASFLLMVWFGLM